MSKHSPNTTDDGTDFTNQMPDAYPPAVSAGDVARGNRPRAHFDNDLRVMIDEYAKERAPTRRSLDRHKVGLAGELAVSGYFQTPISLDTYEGYEGDDGWDLRIPIRSEMWRTQVKTVYQREPILSIDEEEVAKAHYFVLCRTPGPREMVELIGIINRRQLLRRGYRSPSDSLIRVRPVQMQPLEPIVISPDRIREAHSGGGEYTTH